MNDVFSEILRGVMIEKSLTQKELAGILHVNQTTVSQWIRGKKKPNFENIATIYKKFNITPNELFGID